jgi:asparagine synthase (glutamine-hydrolysing)
MCGITGILGLGADLGPADGEALRAMTRVQRHRGPDHTGYAEHPRCALGNTRLEIIDLSDAGALPMGNQGAGEGPVLLAYNGEVTNFRELAHEFRLKDKYEFHSRSDAEVLVHLYEEIGIELCKHLTGMYAFALYDARSQTVHIVRDQYGIRPIFLMRKNGRLYFASEIKALMQVPGFDRSVDEEAMYHYFTLAYIPGRRTPFEAVDELPGGHRLEVDLKTGNIREQVYYRPSYETKVDGDEASIAEALYREMKDSVRRNLISDAPVGLTLSGGFDTSSILALAREVEGDRELHTYSIVMKEKSFDESEYQRLMVDFAKTVHHEIRVGPSEVLGALERHMAFMDEPSANGAAVPSFLMGEEAAKDVKVLLSGEGGDETFTAYETYRAWKVRRWYRRLIPKLGRKLVRGVVHRLPTDYSKLSFDFVAKRFVEGSELDVPRAHIYWRYTLTDADKAELMPGFAPKESTGDLFAEIYDSYDYEHELDRISALDLETYLIGDLMVKNDRTIMAHSVETRFPYMDRKLFDFASSIPADLRLRGLSGRYIQKRAMRGRMPKEILARTNMGLEMPHSIWLLEALGPLVERYLNRDIVEQTGFLSHAKVQSLLDEHRGRRRDNGRALWSIINMVLWFDMFVASDRYLEYLP